MAHFLQPPPPVMRPGAGLHANQTAGAAFEKGEKLVPLELAPQYGLAVGVDAMDLNNVLGQIDPDCAKFEHAWLLLLKQ